MIVQINEKLISEITGYPIEDFQSVQELDLHLREDRYEGKIRKIENLSIVPNLRRLNLSYNIITKIDGLERLVHLSELNLAENSIRKIENMESLKSLEKLNLSGNEIERIPPSIRQLSQLNHLRITRNNLTNLDDIKHLAQLPFLTNFRFDENPFCEDPDYELFAIFHLPMLTFVNGREITDEMREQARIKFASSQRDILVSKLEAERHKLTRLKRNIQKSHLGESRGFDENEILIAQKLEEIQLVELEIFRLEELIDRFDDSPRSSSRQLHQVAIADDFDRLKSNVATPLRSSFQSSFIKTPQSDSIAAKQISTLNDRVEKLASKILTAEKEKLGLQKELDTHRKSDNLVARLKEELMLTEEALEKALTAARESNNDLESGRITWQSTKQQLDNALQDIDKLVQDNHDLVEESKQLHQENRELLQLLEKKDHNDKIYQNRGNVDSKVHEGRVNLLELERINLHLQSELDRHLTESTTLNQHLNRLRDEMDQMKLKLQFAEGQVREQKMEKQLYERNISAMQNERTNLLRSIGTLESNIKALEADLAAVIRAKTNTPMKALSESRRLRNQKSKNGFTGNFLDTWSTESESGLLADDQDLESQSHRYLERVLSSSGKRYSSPSRKADPSSRVPLSKFSMSELERSAAEIMAHIMLEELQHSQPNSSGQSSGRHSSTKNSKHSQANNANPSNPSNMLLKHDLKDACIRAALRLVYTSTNLVQDPELQRALAEELEELSHSANASADFRDSRQKKVTFTPFHALGDRHVLSKLVAETHAGLAAMEEATMFREEINQLEVCIKLMNKILFLANQIYPSRNWLVN